jgi:Tfp pilus assembly protein PilO
VKKRTNPNIFLGAALLALVGGAGACYFELGRVSDTEAKVEALKKDTKSTREVEKDLAASQAKLVDCEAHLKHLEKSLPETAYLPTMLKDLEKTGKDNGIEVVGVRPMPKKPLAKDEKPERKPYSDLDIEVKGHGNYASVLKFVKALNNFPKIVAARTIELTPQLSGNSKEKNDKLDVKVELRAYMFAPKDQPEDRGIKQDG